MADIIYFWGRGLGSVGISSTVELPQFKIVGHKQSKKIEVLSSGKQAITIKRSQTNL